MCLPCTARPWEPEPNGEFPTRWNSVRISRPRALGRQIEIKAWEWTPGHASQPEPLPLAA